MDLKGFLKILGQEGYPNPDLIDIANLVNYNLSEFLPDLAEQLGDTDGVNKFVQQTMRKLLGNDFTKIFYISGPALENSWVKIKFLYFNYNPQKRESSIHSEYKVIDSAILVEDGSYKTIDELSDEVGMGEWGDWEEFLNEISVEIEEQIYKETGMWIYHD